MTGTQTATARNFSPRDFVDDAKAILSDAAHMASLDTKGLLETLFEGIVAYGMSNDPEMVMLLLPHYERVVDEADPDDRVQMCRVISKFVEDGKLSVNALLPFLLVDRDPVVVSSATIHVAMIGRPDSAYDELHWPKYLIRILHQQDPRNRGAVFGGLVLLGDRRVNALLDGVKWTLSAQEIKVAATRQSGFAAPAVLEFWMQWAEELLERGLGETAVYGDCASAMALLVKALGRGYANEFIEAERPLGRLPDEDKAPAINIVERLSVKEVGARYAERLYALEERESAPKVMSHVLTVYGLEPRAALQDRFVMQ